MNQINLGAGCVIDTDDVQFSVVWPKDEQTRVYLRGRTAAIVLRGDAKVAFDEWAEGREDKGTLDEALSVCRPCCWFVSSPLGCRNVGQGACRVEEEPPAHDFRDGASEEWRQKYSHSECKRCRRYNAFYALCMGLSRSYPTCHKERKVFEEREEGETVGLERPHAWPKPLCRTCACFEAGTKRQPSHCTELAGGHYPECWVEREAAKAAGDLSPRGTLCQSCQSYNPATRRCKNRERAEFPECHVDNVWICNGCGVALGTDMKGQIVRVSNGCEVNIQGDVRIQANDVPLVICSKCRTATLWPAELRERVGNG